MEMSRHSVYPSRSTNIPYLHKIYLAFWGLNPPDSLFQPKQLERVQENASPPALKTYCTKNITKNSNGYMTQNHHSLFSFSNKGPGYQLLPPSELLSRGIVPGFRVSGGQYQGRSVVGVRGRVEQTVAFCYTYIYYIYIYITYTYQRTT